MTPEEARAVLEQHVAYSRPRPFQTISAPSPLGTGLFKEGRRGEDVVWFPLKLDDWRRLDSRERVDLVVKQMRYIAQNSGAVVWKDIAAEDDLESLGFTPRLLLEDLHAAVCRIYQEIRERPAGTLVAAGVAVRIVRLIFQDVAPFNELTGDIAVSVVAVYGELYCGGV